MIFFFQNFLLDSYGKKVSLLGDDVTCAEFLVQEEDHELDHDFPNRIDRLAYLRESQRLEMKKMNAGVADLDPEALKKNDFVILLDLDLSEVPSIESLSKTIGFMANDGDSSPDVVCANGLLASSLVPYDTYATVLLPDIWAYPLSYRLNPTPQSDEELKVVTNFLNEAVKQALHSEHDQHPKTDVDSFLPVKSCFGGLAVYRASIWFTEKCEYTRDYKAIVEDGLLQYVDYRHKRVCEHVAFNSCIKEHHEDAKISVHAALLTKYHDTDRFLAMNGEVAERNLQKGKAWNEYGDWIGNGNGYGHKGTFPGKGHGR